MPALSPRSTGESCWTDSGCHFCAARRSHSTKHLLPESTYYEKIFFLKSKVCLKICCDNLPFCCSLLFNHFSLPLYFPQLPVLIILDSYFARVSISSLHQIPIPMTESLDPVSMLTDDAMVAQWNNEGLPGDKMSTQNATILTNCE